MIEFFSDIRARKIFFFCFFSYIKYKLKILKNVCVGSTMQLFLLEQWVLYLKSHFSSLQMTFYYLLNALVYNT